MCHVLTRSVFQDPVVLTREKFTFVVCVYLCLICDFALFLRWIICLNSWTCLCVAALKYILSVGMIKYQFIYHSTCMKEGLLALIRLAKNEKCRCVLNSM